MRSPTALKIEVSDMTVAISTSNQEGREWMLDRPATTTRADAATT